MTLTDFYLVCFIVGFALSVLFALGGMSHLHIPGLPHGHGLKVQTRGGHASIFNLGTIAAFLAWFGGVGFLLSKYSSVWVWLAVGLATAGGLFGGSCVFLFLTKVLLAHENPLCADDYEMTGVLGKLTYAIREGGTGEMIFSQGGTRRSAAARSEDGRAIPKNTDVMITRYEKGIAYVRRWDELTETKENL